jgi:hypothetical protein
VSVRRLLPLLAFAGSCAPTAVALRSNHYRVTLPDGWIVEEGGGSDNEPAVLRIPPAADDRSGEPLELRIYAWTSPASSPDPLREVADRLAGADLDAMRADATADVEECRDIRRAFVMFGVEHGGARLRAKTGHLVVFSAGRNAGSTVAVVGFVPRRDPFCDNIAAIEGAIDAIGRRMTGVDLAASPPPALLSPADLQHQGPVRLR